MTLPDRFDLVLFGGTGDLAMRKLLPALYHRAADTTDTGGWRIFALGRHAMDREGYVGLAREACLRHVASHRFEEAAFDRLAARLEYACLDVHDDRAFDALSERLAVDAASVRVFYLATAPDLFTIICDGLARAGLVNADARVVLEKPLGHDLASSNRINEHVARVFDESQIYRIDHYVGKETVQNLLALRFGNALLEPLWNRTWIDNVQITISETVGVEARGDFYDRTGALRDMVQNHLLQLLCIIAMEPPRGIDADSLRDEKLKVLRALRPIRPEQVGACVVRGQYRAGAIDGHPVPSYRDEPGISPHSVTETFVALRAEVGNWRWAGVPFYLRTGKRMPERLAEIVIRFRGVPHPILPASSDVSAANTLVIRLQPEESVKLMLMAKVPGDHMRMSPVCLDLDFGDAFKNRRWDAYERLLMDVIRGRLTLFMRRDELEAAWHWVEPILHGWAESAEPPRPYTAGTWGPSASSALLLRDGFSWSEDR